MVRNVFEEKFLINREEREELLKQKGRVLWFTGLSGSGKSTIAKELERELIREGILCRVLDGDNLRGGLCRDLGFSDEDRAENMRRVREVSKLLLDTGVVVIVSLISPFKSEREEGRRMFGEDFLEVYVNTPIEICEARDVKGLYKRARKGEIEGFTGITSPFEEPENPEILLDTSRLSLKECVGKVLEKLKGGRNGEKGNRN
ncbi:MAG: adenylyl-sulfate kinase [Clostridium sp.]